MQINIELSGTAQLHGDTCAASYLSTVVVSMSSHDSRGSDYPNNEPYFMFLELKTCNTVIISPYMGYFLYFSLVFSILL